MIGIRTGKLRPIFHYMTAHTIGMRTAAITTTVVKFSFATFMSPVVF